MHGVIYVVTPYFFNTCALMDTYQGWAPLNRKDNDVQEQRQIKTNGALLLVSYHTIGNRLFDKCQIIYQVFLGTSVQRNTVANWFILANQLRQPPV